MPPNAPSALIEGKRLRLLAAAARGRVLDLGYDDYPNPYLTGATGFDRHTRSRPSNYSAFVEGDVHQLSRSFAPGSFDTVLAGETIEHVENASEFLRQIARVLAPGGRAVLSTPNPYNPWTAVANMLLLRPNYADHLMLFSAPVLRSLARYVGFRVRSIMNGSGVQVVPFHSRWSRSLYLPSPAGIARHLVYTLELPSGGLRPRPVVPERYEPSPRWHLRTGRWSRAPVRTVRDATAGPPSGNGDAGTVVVESGIEYLENPAAFLRACARALGPGGRLIARVPNAYAARAVCTGIRLAAPGPHEPLARWPFWNFCELLIYAGFRFVSAFGEAGAPTALAPRITYIAEPFGLETRSYT